MIALVTDSNAQLPPVLRERYRVKVVPLTIVVDGRAFREGVDLTNELFYERLRAGAEVTTAAPSPGEVLHAYDEALDEGAESIVSVHVGSELSGTLNAVQLAARRCRAPVEVVDSGTASFALGCCVWAGGDALASGAGVVEAAAVARSTARAVGNVFVVESLELARKGGRAKQSMRRENAVPVLALQAGEIHAVGQAADAEEAVETMASYVRSSAEGLPVRVGVGDAEAPEAADRLADRIAATSEVAELVRYEVGPSVGAHTGPGTVGAVFFRTGTLHQLD